MDIERDAIGYKPREDGLDPGRAMASAVISLKRIADAAERVADTVEQLARAMNDFAAEARANRVVREILETER